MLQLCLLNLPLSCWEKSKPSLYCAGYQGFCSQSRPAHSRNNGKALGGVVSALLPLMSSQVKHYRHYNLLLHTCLISTLQWLFTALSFMGTQSLDSHSAETGDSLFLVCMPVSIKNEGNVCTHMCKMSQ